MGELKPILPTVGILLVTPDAFHCRVHVRGRKSLTPDQARELAVELFYLADEAEDDSDMAGFGYEPDDSRRLAELRSAIDEELGWASDDEEIMGDYHARLKQVGQILRQKHLRVVKS
jgi:hypothetical protein